MRFLHMRKITLNETPRPQFVRQNYTSLDGVWDFRFDDEDNGEILNYQAGFEKEYDIKVPFAYQTPASGINIQTRCDHVWYQRHISIKKQEGKRYLLHLEGSDYITKVYLNGKYVGRDIGCYHRETFDLTDFIDREDNLLVIKCSDDYSTERPRGKQRWKDENFECFYVDTTGLYKTVWMEEVSDTYLNTVKITPNFNKKNVEFIFDVLNIKKNSLLVRITYEGKLINEKEIKVHPDKENRMVLSLGEEIYPWEVGDAKLYDVEFILKDKENIIDEVSSYFGLRKIEAKKGQIYLNGHVLYQRLVLDQGYYLEGHLTQINNEQLLKDITLMQEAGFNGCRKHEKVEDERFLYYADILGYLMWSEMPSMYTCTAKARQTFEKEWMRTMKQQYNHPCVITWTIFNESWGIPNVKTNKVEQDFAVRMYNITREYDKTRFIQVNDGWDHTVSDIASIHHYEQDPELFRSCFDRKSKITGKKFKRHSRSLMCDGYKYKGQPFMFTEFGGTAYEGATKGTRNWGYGTSVKDDEDFLARFGGLIKAINSYPYSCGYCYTQLSDVQQEVNGLLYENRTPKIPLAKIKEILDER